MPVEGARPILDNFGAWNGRLKPPLIISISRGDALNPHAPAVMNSLIEDMVQVSA